jgi:Peptidase family M1 domain
MTISRALALLLALIALSACALVRAGEAVVSQTPTPIHAIQTTPVPTLERQTRTVPTSPPEPSSTPGNYQCDLDTRDAVPQYTVIADMTYKSRSLIVQQQIDYSNNTGQALNQLVLNVRPNVLPDVFKLQSLSLISNSMKLHSTFKAERLSVDLPEALEPDCRISLKISFRLQIPKIDMDSVNAYQGYLGYSARQANLGQWLPVVSVHQGEDWITHEEIPIGEQEVLDDANWDITLNIKDAPDNLKVAAPGDIKADENGHWQFVLLNARDFSLSMGENFHLTTQTTESGVQVELYTFDDAQLQSESGSIDTAAFALDSATKALSMYEDLYGKFPYKRMVVVEGDFPDGMEFSGIVFVGREYFRSFNGPTSYLMIITVHEISHQWWYARVGNDQAINPWLDEALATYSEYVFIEEYYPALKDWWWNFRVNSLAPQGYVDSTVYEFTTRRAYINAVYLCGVQMLNDLRTDLGTEAFFDWLHRYAEAGAGRVMTPENFWSLLTPEQLQATSGTRSIYLRHPQISVTASH